MTPTAAPPAPAPPKPPPNRDGSRPTRQLQHWQAIAEDAIRDRDRYRDALELLTRRLGQAMDEVRELMKQQKGGK